MAGVRTTKGLFLVFTLLCLVCLSSSRVNKDQLVNMMLFEFSDLLASPQCESSHTNLLLKCVFFFSCMFSHVCILILILDLQKNLKETIQKLQELDMEKVSHPYEECLSTISISLE